MASSTSSRYRFQGGRRCQTGAHGDAAPDDRVPAHPRCAGPERGRYLVVLPEAQAALFGGGSQALKLANPISSELSDMRPSLFPNLIAAVAATSRKGIPRSLCSRLGRSMPATGPKTRR